MNTFMPTKVFLTRGRGQHREKLVSFERALRDAAISPFNLVRVSSIFPPHSRLVSREEGLKLLKPGQVVFVVLSENSTDEARRVISASIGIAVPNDPGHYGYLAEHEGFGCSEKEAGLHTEYLAAEMLATKMGKKLRDSKPLKKGFQVSNGMSLRTRSITQVGEGRPGLWTTVLAAAVLVIET